MKIAEPLAKPERNYGIDLLRIISMMMVCLLHVLGQGGILDKCTKYSAHYELAWLMEIGAYCAVNCYALISGYVGIKSKYKYSNLAYICLQVLFHMSWLFLLSPWLATWKTGIEITIDIFLGKSYWYVVAYIGLFFFMPILNVAIENLSRRTLKYSLIALLTCAFVLSGFHRDIFDFDGGYSVIWLMVLYLLGGYLRKYEPLKKCKLRTALLCVAALLLATWISKFMLGKLGARFARVAPYENFFVSYTSFTIVAGAVLLLEVCSRLQFKRKPRFIAFVAPLAFGVYVIHSHPLIYGHWMDKAFVWYVSYPLPLMALAAVGTTLGIFLACIAIDYVRLQIFKWCRVKTLLEKLETKLLNKKTDTEG